MAFEQTLIEPSVWFIFGGENWPPFLASQDALEVMLFTEWVGVSIDLTDVTLVSDDT